MEPKFNISKLINSTSLTLAFTLFFSVIINLKIINIYLAEHSLITLSDFFQMLFFFLFITLLLFSLFSIFNFRVIQKCSYIVFLQISVPCLYFAFKYNVIFDQSMVRNLIETDISEAGDLLSYSFWLVFVLLGVVPSVIIWKLPLTYKKMLPRFAFNAMQSITAFALCILLVYPFYANLSSFVRNNKTLLVNSFLPYAPIHSLYKNIKENYSERRVVKQIVDPNAHRNIAAPKSNKKPLALVVIVGESAREKSFSNSKFDFDNDELLGHNNIIYFKNFWSCGTNTAASLPCMFSTYSKNDFHSEYNRKYENVAEIAKRVGIDVIWRDNNSGCKGICDRLVNEPVNFNNSVLYRHEDKFFDEALVEGLAADISKRHIDQVMFLHQMGSHGPAYFKRVPDEYKKTQPSCESEDFSDCNDEEITNAYDNTIIYTKHVITRAISELETLSSDYDTVLFYLSDHGESTGENGYYLHGLPYFLAPEEQTHIPALIWMSNNYIATRHIDMSCMNERAMKYFSHDNFSHSVLDLMDVETSVYKPSMSILNDCQPTKPPALFASVSGGR